MEEPRAARRVLAPSSMVLSSTELGISWSLVLAPVTNSGSTGYPLNFQFHVQISIWVPTGLLFLWGLAHILEKGGIWFHLVQTLVKERSSKASHNRSRARGACSGRSPGRAGGEGSTREAPPPVRGTMTGRHTEEPPGLLKAASFRHARLSRSRSQCLSLEPETTKPSPVWVSEEFIDNGAPTSAFRKLCGLIIGLFDLRLLLQNGGNHIYLHRRPED